MTFQMDIFTDLLCVLSPAQTNIDISRPKEVIKTYDYDDIPQLPVVTPVKQIK